MLVLVGRMSNMRKVKEEKRRRGKEPRWSVREDEQ